ncbi:MAG: methionine adenosyltransferase [Gammaproteobacteria bacterium]|nr:methionine adenosyltransferase [Gammaproteobacteria bacterium]
MGPAVEVTWLADACRYRRRHVEMCEHKGVGHPDSLCDGVVEAVSLALNAAYREAYGRIAHYNVDKALLVGGASRPRFGGGEVLTPMRLIVAGRATPLPGRDLEALVCTAARDYLARRVRWNAAHWRIESAVRPGSANLQRVVASGTAPARANDTSFGVGFAPFTPLEAQVLRLAERLRAPAFRQAFPAAGDDFKIMGARVGSRYDYTLALAFVDREIRAAGDYFALKEAIGEDLRRSLVEAGDLAINSLDDPAATGEEGLYLTVTGLSAEQGDDGEVGRGNRMCGLITPCRSMSLEAAAGKNPVAHVGKLYNALALEMARALVAEIDGVAEATVHLLSRIGLPVDQPALAAVELGGAGGLTPARRRAVRDVVRARLAAIEETAGRLERGETPVF